MQSAPPRMDEEGARSPGPTYSYAGSGKGNYVQECKYKYVGDERGQFEMVSVRKKRPNHVLFFGLAGAAVIVGLLCLAFVQSHATAMAKARAQDRRSQTSLARVEGNAPLGTGSLQGEGSPQAQPVAGAVSPGGDSLRGAAPPTNGAAPTQASQAGPLAVAPAAATAMAPATTLAPTTTTTSDPYSNVPKFACSPQGLDPGARIQAAADIAFKPAGLVEEGALGRVVVDGPADAQNNADTPPAERVVVISWDGIPGLRDSRVTRDMVIKAMVVGDTVEAMMDTVYVAADPKAFPPAKLAVADLVRATQDLGGVRKGTFGTVVAGPDDQESWRVSDTARVVVSFMGQLSTMKVLDTHVRKAPQVGELVRTLADAGSADNLVPKGSIGVVRDVKTGDNGGDFGFVVDWRDHATTQMTESELEILQEPEGAIIPRGTKGKVVVAKAMADKQVPLASFVVDWEGFNGPGAVVERRHLTKVDDWPKGKAEWCCREEDALCDQADGTVGHYRCDRGDPQDWIPDKAKWCCRHKDHGCRAAGEAPKLSSTPRPFDPAPRTVQATTRRPPAALGLGIA